MPDFLHSIRSLLCLATNKTPHECFLFFPRRSSVGDSISTWIIKPGPVFLKQYVRTSKTNPLVEEVSLIEANNYYAHVRFRDRRETTVGTKYLAPVGTDVQEVTELCKDNNQNHGISNVKNIQGDTNISEEISKNTEDKRDVPMSTKKILSWRHLLNQFRGQRRSVV